MPGLANPVSRRYSFHSINSNASVTGAALRGRSSLFFTDDQRLFFCSYADFELAFERLTAFFDVESDDIPNSDMRKQASSASAVDSFATDSEPFCKLVRVKKKRPLVGDDVDRHKLE